MGEFGKFGEGYMEREGVHMSQQKALREGRKVERKSDHKIGMEERKEDQIKSAHSQAREGKDR